MRDYDAFISYASEDAALASEIAGGLKSNGFQIWYDKFALRVGDKLLEAIEEGLAGSKHGILILSEAYIAKGWPKYEMDTLIRQSIETGKKLLPIWHKVSEAQIEERYPGLAGFYALDATLGTRVLVSKLTEVLSLGAPTRGLTPSYATPGFRFLRGRGELRKNTQDGRVFTLWLALEYFEDDEYPILIEGQVFDKSILLYFAAENLAVDEWTFKEMLGDDDYEKFWRMCVEAGFDPAKLR